MLVQIHFDYQYIFCSKSRLIEGWDVGLQYPTGESARSQSGPLVVRVVRKYVATCHSVLHSGHLKKNRVYEAGYNSTVYCISIRGLMKVVSNWVLSYTVCHRFINNDCCESDPENVL